MNLLRALATVSSLTFVSRILGYVRDFIIARAFGAGLGTDAFFVAFRIPNLLRRLFAEGAFSQAFVPVLAGAKAEDEQGVKTLIDGVATLLFLALVLAAALGVLLAPFVVWISAPASRPTPSSWPSASRNCCAASSPRAPSRRRSCRCWANTAPATATRRPARSRARSWRPSPWASSW
jgi:peptidoglycan biosynthesis protein MviN/MurJ (putative lipid II flippase)